MNQTQRGAVRKQSHTPPKPSGIAPLAFGISVTFTIVLAVILVILMVLYFRRDTTLIKASECPEKVTGLLVQGDKIVTQAASNCGTQIDCLFQVESVQEAVTKCTDLGIDKCKSFSLTQIPDTDLYDMQVSDGIDTSVSVGTDTFRTLT
jgi:hypothetical protein